MSYYKSEKFKKERAQRATIANESIFIGNKGFYFLKEVKINLPNFETDIISDVKISDVLTDNNWFSYTGNVVDESVLKIAKEGVNKNLKVAVLNFASATSPGGGVKNGSNAQEEYITRHSNLYTSLNTQYDAYYKINKDNKNPLYTDTLIYSQNISVFRENENLIKPFQIDVITSPAPNAGVALKRSISPREIDIALKKRIYTLIQVAVDNKIEYLVLGAFGCGVFKNDSARVAYHFKNAINQLVKKDTMIIKFAILNNTYPAFK